ncbi:hypothetical protein VN97_g12759 [Penicillium thymicola]|uniref:Uncharacterized protein n=1 Tax=Penicillium thymicola TaxID=293382 RepID=A0AAI9T6D2_PENTH|nr:hypothetical protein VN97_g12759 [Penicillium thymicola]
MTLDYKSIARILIVINCFNRFISILEFSCMLINKLKPADHRVSRDRYVAVVIVINIVSNNSDVNVIFISAANNHGNQLAADIKSGEDAENRDQSEFGRAGY